MRRRHSVAAVALGAALTTGALAVGSMIESPGIPGHQLIDGAANVLRLSDTAATTTIATAPAKAIAKHQAKTRTVKVKVRHARRHAAQTRHAATAPARRRNTLSGATHRRRATTPAPTTTTKTTPAPATAPAPTVGNPVATAPSAPTAKSSRAGLKVTAASVGRDGNVNVRLAVSQPDATAATALPDQLDVNVNLAALTHSDGSAGPMALDTALDLVPDPSQTDGVRLRMRMQLAPSDSAAPTAPAEDPTGLSNVVTLRLAVPTSGDASAPSAPAPAEPVEVQLPIAPTDPASQTVQLPVPPATDGGDDPQPAVPVDVTVTPVETTPAPTDPTATPAPADPTATPAPADPTATPAPADPTATPAPADPTATPAN